MTQLSIIIPTLNEEKLIERTLLTVKEAAPDAEVIVVDGGSSDATIARASQHALTTIRATARFDESWFRTPEARLAQAATNTRLNPLPTTRQRCYARLGFPSAGGCRPSHETRAPPEIIIEFSRKWV